MAREGTSHHKSEQPAPSKPGNTSQAVILVIDDDDEVLHAIRRTLSREGWVIHTSDNPIDALKLYETHWRDIQLVVLDYFMHILRGDEVFERLQRINPHVRVLLTTACDGDISDKMRKSGLCGYVQKPLSARDLVDQVRAALSAPTRL